MALSPFIGTVHSDDFDTFIAGDLRDAPKARKGRGPRSWPPKQVQAKFWENIYRLEARNAMYMDRHGGREYVETIRKQMDRLPQEARLDSMKRFLGISYSFRVKEDPKTPDTRRVRFQRRFESMVRDFHELAQRERVQNGNSTYEELFATIRALANVGPEGEKLAYELRNLAPTNSRVHADYGQDLLDSGKIEQAVYASQRSIELNPLSPQPHRTLAQAKYQQEDYAGAFHAAKTALSLDPKDSVSFSIMQLSKSRVPNLDETRVEEVDEIPDVASSNGFAGLSHLARNTIDMSERTALVDAAAAPGVAALTANSSGNLMLAKLDRQLRMEISKGDNARAVALATRALQQHRGNWVALFRRAQAELRQGNLKEALTDTTKALELAGEDVGPVLLTLHARVLNRLGRHSEALAASESALLLPFKQPKDRGRAFFQKAWALAGVGRATDALAALGRAAKLDTQYVAFYQELLTLPDDSNMTLMFAAQDNFGSRVLQTVPEKKPIDSKKRTLRILMFSLAGGILVALGLLHVLSGTRRSTTGGAASLAGGSEADGLIAGTYRIQRKIAKGGMGIVYEAEDVHLERRVAIKKMREEISFDRRERERFLREARTVARLKHPNIVEIHSVVGEGDDIYLVFEYVDGHTVDQYISGYGRIPFDQAVRIVQGVAAALSYAHKKGVIHRDLKPSNIMISSEGMVKVMDFGVARQAKESMSNIVSQTISGTPQYMPPEQEQGRVVEASDVYGMAVCFYEMLTGDMPFAGTAGGMSINKIRRKFEPVTRRNPSLPTGLDQVMEWALEPDPAKRCQTPMKFTAALESLLQPKVGPFDAV